MAERQGFEPWVGSHPQRFSRPPHSTTLPPLRVGVVVWGDLSCALRACNRYLQLFAPLSGWVREVGLARWGQAR